LRQINFALLFSEEAVMLKAMPGSARDVKYFSSVIEEFDMRRCILIMDRGFFSMDNIEDEQKGNEVHSTIEKKFKDHRLFNTAERIICL
jgi:transposase